MIFFIIYFILNFKKIFFIKIKINYCKYFRFFKISFVLNKKKIGNLVFNNLKEKIKKKKSKYIKIKV